MFSNSSERSAEFIDTAIAISDALEDGQSPNALIGSISEDFGVNIKVGSNWSDFMFSSSSALTFTVGGGGNDLILGYWGTDVMFGGSGHDLLVGWYGDDALFGGSGNDRLYGGSGDDFLRGGTGNDRLNGGRGDDELQGNDGNDYLFGRDGDDILNGGFGDDVVLGGDGNDFIQVSSGDDFLSGGRGHDIIEGGFGDDRLYGGDGDDFLRGGSGDDFMDGGEGADRFFFDPNNGEEGADIINDFELGTDSIVIFEGAILASTPDLANADGDPALDIGSDLDASALWLLQASEDGDLEIVHANGTIELNDIPFDDALTFSSLIDDGVLGIL